MGQMWWLVFMLYSADKIKLWTLFQMFRYVAALLKQKSS